MFGHSQFKLTDWMIDDDGFIDWFIELVLNKKLEKSH